MTRASGVTVRRRLFILLAIGTLIFIALIIRLAYVQLVIGPDLAERAENTWRRDLTYNAKRGEVLDRTGVKLAYNVSTPSIIAVPVQVIDKKGTSLKLAQVLGGSEENIYKQLTKKASSVDIKPSGRKISQEKAQEVRDLKLPGIHIVEDNTRYYPYGELAAHILGITGAYNQGLTGVEAKYEKGLTGLAGSVSYLSDASGKEMPGSTEQYVKPMDGMNLQLTIDSNLQMFMERELDQAMVKTQANSALAIMMDPNNGEILAMASRPTFEPGNYKQYPQEIYNRNLPIWMTYEPGSTFKIITLAAALEEKKIDLKYDYFYDSGLIDVSGSKLRCWKRGGHGSESFMQVVENSCNPGFVVMGQRLGKETLFDYIKNFGFGKKTGIDLGGEENGILFKLSRVGPVELATTAFGQGVSVTPIQQVAAVAAAINGGKLYEPHVGKAWIHPETGAVVEEFQPEEVRRVISEETSKKVREALESVVAKGTGRPAFIDGYRVGGKTGTAQKVINGRYSSTEHIVSFIGFAPADNPKVLVYVAVDNPQGIQFGGVVAAPIVQNILRDSLNYMKVEPNKNQLAKDYKIDETPIVEVPNLVGMTVADIYESMNSNFMLVKSGEGNTVISQAPAAGTRVDRGSTIRVYLSSPPEGSR
jgi:stage V sporulation protein D (sporulation-specific penicillin-binding protein)